MPAAAWYTACHMKHRDQWLNEFTVFGAFLVISLTVLLYGAATALFADRSPEEIMTAVVPIAPTVEEYRTEASRAAAGFLRQAATLTVESIPLAGEALPALVEVTEQRMLDLRVPAEMREVHLRVVLLLNQWKRALAGSAEEQTDAIEATRTLLETEPWLAPSP